MGKSNSNNNNSYVDSYTEDRTCPISWSIHARRTEGNNYKVTVSYTLYDLESKQLNPIVKKGETVLNLDALSLENEIKQRDLDLKNKGDFGLPPLYGCFKKAAEECKSELAVKIKRAFKQSGLSGLEDLFLNDQKLLDEAIYVASDRKLYDERDGLIEIKRGEAQNDEYVGCISYA